MPWLMKAEPDSRIVKGKDVKFSVDDFEALGVSQWDGVRSFEARNIMRDRMKLGDQVLFYHSNCKTPGVYAVAEIAREGYPDYTAWDPSHPYYDEKTKKDDPTWMMVDVKFIRRLDHPPTLNLIKHLATMNKPPPEIDYIGTGGLQAIKEMHLINRGRLTHHAPALPRPDHSPNFDRGSHPLLPQRLIILGVQPVAGAAFEAVVLMGDRGGWDGLVAKTSKKPTQGRGDVKTGASHLPRQHSKGKAKMEPGMRSTDNSAAASPSTSKRGREVDTVNGLRRSKRRKA